MISTEINSSIEKKFADESIVVPMFPVNAYNDSEAPFIIYNEFPVPGYDIERFYVEASNMTYVIYDHDLQNARDIQRVLKNYLNVGDQLDKVRYNISVSNPVYRILNSKFVSGGMFPPAERDGFYSISLTFTVKYIRLCP